MDIDKLKRPFAPDEIKFRVGSTNKKKVARETGNPQAKATKGSLLAYIDARAAYDRLDDVCGDLWQCRYPEKGLCEIGVKIDGEWLWRANGAGETDIEGEKGQYSDAFKRAAVLWGIGRYLYHLPSDWVDLDQWGKPVTLPTLPDWALPGYTPKMDRNLKRQYVEQITQALSDCDEDSVRQLAGELTSEQKLYIWSEFNSGQRSLIKEYIK